MKGEIYAHGFSKDLKRDVLSVNVIKALPQNLTYRFH